MTMSLTSRVVYAASFIIAGAGFLWPLWPLCALGVALASLSGRWVFGVFLGLLIDIAWGPPAGVLHYVYFPFAALALACALAGWIFSGYFLNKTPPDTL